MFKNSIDLCHSKEAPSLVSFIRNISIPLHLRIRPYASTWCCVIEGSCDFVTISSGGNTSALLESIFCGEDPLISKTSTRLLGLACCESGILKENGVNQLKEWCNSKNNAGLDFEICENHLTQHNSLEVQPGVAFTATGNFTMVFFTFFSNELNQKLVSSRSLVPSLKKPDFIELRQLSYSVSNCSEGVNCLCPIRLLLGGLIFAVISNEVIDEEEYFEDAANGKCLVCFLASEEILRLDEEDKGRNPSKKRKTEDSKLLEICCDSGQSCFGADYAICRDDSGVWFEVKESCLPHNVDDEQVKWFCLYCRAASFSRVQKEVTQIPVSSPASSTSFTTASIVPREETVSYTPASSNDGHRNEASIIPASSPPVVLNFKTFQNKKLEELVGHFIDVNRLISTGTTTGSSEYSGLWNRRGLSKSKKGSGFFNASFKEDFDVGLIVSRTDCSSVFRNRDESKILKLMNVSTTECTNELNFINAFQNPSHPFEELKPFIVNYLEVLRDDRIDLMVLKMDKYEQNLKAYIQDHKQDSLVEKIRICVRMCEIFEALHRCSLVHGDVKLDNFLLNNDAGSLVLTDFGKTTSVGSKVVLKDSSKRLSVSRRFSLHRHPNCFVSAEEVGTYMDLYGLARCIITVLGSLNEDYANEFRNLNATVGVFKNVVTCHGNCPCVESSEWKKIYHLISKWYSLDSKSDQRLPGAGAMKLLLQSLSDLNGGLPHPSQVTNDCGLVLLVASSSSASSTMSLQGGLLDTEVSAPLKISSEFTLLKDNLPEYFKVLHSDKIKQLSGLLIRYDMSTSTGEDSSRTMLVTCNILDHDGNSYPGGELTLEENNEIQISGRAFELFFSQCLKLKFSFNAGRGQVRRSRRSRRAEPNDDDSRSMVSLRVSPIYSSGGSSCENGTNQ